MNRILFKAEAENIATMPQSAWSFVSQLDDAFLHARMPVNLSSEMGNDSLQSPSQKKRFTQVVLDYAILHNSEFNIPRLVVWTCPPQPSLYDIREALSDTLETCAVPWSLKPMIGHSFVEELGRECLELHACDLKTIVDELLSTSEGVLQNLIRYVGPLLKMPKELVL